MSAALERTDPFAALLGAGRGSPEHEQVWLADSLDARSVELFREAVMEVQLGRLERAIETLRRHRARLQCQPTPALENLREALVSQLARSAHRQDAPRARRALDALGIRLPVCEGVLGSNADRMLHLYPDGARHPEALLSQAGERVRLQCGVVPAPGLYYAPRGAWAKASAVSAAGAVNCCPTCALHSAEHWECSETEDYPLFADPADSMLLDTALRRGAERVVRALICERERRQAREDYRALAGRALSETLDALAAKFRAVILARRLSDQTLARLRAGSRAQLATALTDGEFSALLSVELLDAAFASEREADARRLVASALERRLEAALSAR